jgi:hypothetical protein
MRHVVEELRVVLRLARVEAVLVDDADHELVHERHPEARDLRPRSALDRDLVHDFARGRRVDDARLPQARARPPADDRRRVDQEALRDLEHERRDVLVREVVGLRVRRAQRVQVHEVERLAEVDHERVLALSDEHPPDAPAGQLDVVHVGGSVRLVVGDRLLADVVDGLREHLGLRVVVQDGSDRAVAPVAEDDLHGEALADVQIARIAGSDAAHVQEGDGHLLRHARRTDVERDVLQRVREAELERDVLDRIAVVVDVDLVQRVRIEAEVVRTAVRVLQRQVVRHERDEVLLAGLVAREHVEIGRVDLGVPSDVRSLAMARGGGP